MTLAALFVSSLAMAQMPYNPDSNGDYMVGSGDLLTFLTFYGNELIQSDLTCDYEGTELEQLFAGIIDQSLILDSVYVEYVYVDSVVTYLPGCPNPVNIETVLNRSYTLTNQYSNFQGSFIEVRLDGSPLGFYRKVRLLFYPNTGNYLWSINDYEIDAFFAVNDLSYFGEDHISIPFPDSLALTENGLEGNWSTWVNEAANFRLIPFWSVAE